jgi:hypothetical protein
MNRSRIAPVVGAAVALLVAMPASGQTIDDVCPGAPAGTGAMWGSVTDSDAEMMLPGAAVIASWDVEGQERRAQVEVGADGLYAMCLPMERALSVRVSLATVSGAPLDLTLTEVFTRQDLSVSMTGADDDRVWVCIENGQSIINTQFTRLIRCEEYWQPLEQCPKAKELGRINVQPIGAGSGMIREMVEQFAQEAKRLGANAVINVSDGRGGTSWGTTQHTMAMTGEAVLIEVDPSTCS